MKKKKILLIAGGVAGGFVLLTAVLIMVFVVPPPAKKVCKKMQTLTVAELAEEVSEEEAQEMVDEAMPLDDCIKEEKDRREISSQGLIPMTKEAKCILKADSLEDLEDCE